MRNFGVTARPASGEQPPAGPHYAHDTQRDSIPNLILFPSRSPLELREISKPSPEELEADSFKLFFAVVFGPSLCVCAAVIGYALFIA